MAKQNFIARALRSLGGDSFTQESTNASLKRVLRDIQKSTVRLDLQTDKWILFSNNRT